MNKKELYILACKNKPEKGYEMMVLKIHLYNDRWNPPKAVKQ